MWARAHAGGYPAVADVATGGVVGLQPGVPIWPQSPSSHVVGQRLRHVRLEDLARPHQRPLIHVGAAAFLPVFAHAPVDERRLRLLTHVRHRRVQAHEVAERTHASDAVYRQALVAHPDAAADLPDQARDLVVDDQLRVVEGDARLDHPQAVD